MFTPSRALLDCVAIDKNARLRTAAAVRYLDATQCGAETVHTA